ncbi:hypothetical protein C4D60_Mb02t06030 [Musa balbisiana]|uniref:Carboxypeptidase n=1 Tax=Musa balbisiana TaxID=52838 RepID=A0A4V4H2H0_MUSBA|nr:hypothetical protein C4D60_Mb02t06030 [Musa balbisiana]
MVKTSPASSARLLLPLLLCCFLLSVKICVATGTADGSEQWGYVEVRPKAHLFWWRYRSPQRIENGSTPWPTVLWLQGGPGASGVGIGNFQEIGPLDADLKPRKSTWLQKADLLFVDNPVGTGFSYVEDESLFVRTDVEAAVDLTTLLKKLYGENESWRNSPLFIVAESYGGKYAVTVALTIVEAIKAGELKLNFGGVALGDSWISPEDFVASLHGLFALLTSQFLVQTVIFLPPLFCCVMQFSWGPLLRDVSRLDIKDDFYNFLLDLGNDPISLTAVQQSEKLTMKAYSTYLSSKASSSADISSLMNGVIREKLKIIPKTVSWGSQSDDVFNSLSSDFMRPRIREVDELLSLGINVTIYNGQVDLICATKGTEAWVQKLKWEGLKDFNSIDRTPCTTEEPGVTKGFLKSYKNLHFYWILGAGHFVPVDQPCLSQDDRWHYPVSCCFFLLEDEVVP